MGEARDLSQRGATLVARDGPTVTALQNCPPYPPLGVLSLDEHGLHWTSTPRTWRNVTRWWERPRDPPDVFVGWEQVQEMRLRRRAKYGRRDLMVRLADGPYSTERWRYFGDIPADAAEKLFESLGCRLTPDPTQPEDIRVSLPFFER